MATRPNQPPQGPSGSGSSQPGDEKNNAQNSPAGQQGPPTQGPPEPKQGAITPEDLKPAQPKRWRVPGFKGSYLDARFNDEGVSDKPVSEKTAEEFRAQFPNAGIEEVDEEGAGA